MSDGSVLASPLSRGVALRRAIEALGERESRLLAVLGLSGPSNISRVTRLAAVAGLRASVSRQFSTTALREVLDQLAGRGFVTIGDGVYQCAHGAGFAAMKVAHDEGSLARLASAVKAELHPERSYYSNNELEAELFTLRVLLASNDAGASQATLRAAGNVPPVELATEVLLPA